MREVREALEAGARGEIEDEIGDLLFAVVNLARHAGVDPEVGASRRQREVRAPLRRRRASACGRWQAPADASLDDMEDLWVKAKTAERRSA